MTQEPFPFAAPGWFPWEDIWPYSEINFFFKILPVFAFDSRAQGLSTPLTRRRSSYPPSSPNLVLTFPRARRTPYWRFWRGAPGETVPTPPRCMPPLFNQPAGLGGQSVGGVPPFEGGSGITPDTRRKDPHPNPYPKTINTMNRCLRERAPFRTPYRMVRSVLLPVPGSELFSIVQYPRGRGAYGAFGSTVVL